MFYLEYDSSVIKLLEKPGEWFDDIYENDWFDDQVVEEYVETIDGVTHLADSIFKHPTKGVLYAYQLSDAVKTLILCYYGMFPNHTYPLSALTSACYPLLDKIPFRVSVTFYADCLPEIEHWGCTMVSTMTGEDIESTEELRLELGNMVERCAG